MSQLQFERVGLSKNFSAMFKTPIINAKYAVKNYSSDLSYNVANELLKKMVMDALTETTIADDSMISVTVKSEKLQYPLDTKFIPMKDVPLLNFRLELDASDECLYEILGDGNVDFTLRFLRMGSYIYPS